MPTNRIATYAAVLAVSILIGFGAVYVMVGQSDNKSTVGTVKKSADLEKTLAPREPGAGTPLTARRALSKGDMATFVFRREPVPLVDIAFQDADGKERRLSDWKGRVVLLNLWATWCAPCRREMPDLDRLQEALGSDAFEVVALAVDRTGVAGARAFLEKVGVKALKLYADPTARTATALKAQGMPTTLLIDPQGREIGRLTGAAEWNGDDAHALLKAMIGELLGN